KRGARLPPTAQELHPDRRELLVPWSEARHQSGVDRALLQQTVPAREYLAIPNESWHVVHVEPRGEPIDEVPARSRPTVHDLEILPAERDRSRPLRGCFAGRLPHGVYELAQHSTGAGPV